MALSAVAANKMKNTLVWHPSGGVVTAGEGRTKIGTDDVYAAADKLSGREPTVRANLAPVNYPVHRPTDGLRMS